MQNNFLQYAREYAEVGISVFPLTAGAKTPLAAALPLYEGRPSWTPFQTERVSKEKITEWWTKWPDANIAGVMGEISGIICVDQDVAKDKNEMPILDELGEPTERGDITGFPSTLSTTTWSGGKHFLYKYITGVPTRHGFRKMLDVQSNGTYIVLPPSTVNGRSYQWNDNWQEKWKILKPFPIEVLSKTEIVFAPKLDIKKHVDVEHGGRNDAMHRLVCSLYSRGYTDDEVVFIAGEINRTYQPPIGEGKGDAPNELQKILHSAKKFISTQKNVGYDDAIMRSELEATAVMTCFADIAPEEIKWLWPDRIALGKLTMIAGDPGLGKSLIWTCMAAHVSKGKEWPVDNTPCPVGDVVVLSAEDDVADTIRPRLDAAGANCKHVHILQAVRRINNEGKPTERFFSLREDIKILEQTLPLYPDCRLVVIDPVSAYLDQADSHNNSDIRGLLAPLAKLAAEKKIAVVLIDHLNKNEAGKNALYRVIGSIAFTAAPRAAYLVTRDLENSTRCFLMPIKNNLAVMGAGFAYVVCKTEKNIPFIAWEPNPIKLSVDEILTPPKPEAKQTETEEAVDFLKELLSRGPVPATEAIKKGQQVGISSKSLRRAREKLKITPQKSSFEGHWVWGITQGAQDAQSVKPDKPGILGVQGHLGDTQGESTEKMTDAEWFDSLPSSPPS